MNAFISKIMRKIKELNPIASAEVQYHNLLETQIYKPALTKLERASFLPELKSESWKVGPACAVHVCVARAMCTAISCHPDRSLLNLAAAYQVSRLFCSNTTTTISGVMDFSFNDVRFDFRALPFDRALSFVKCIPFEVRMMVSSFAAQMQIQVPDIIYCEGWPESLAGFWAARLLGIPVVIIHGDMLAAMCEESTTPDWFKEQLSFFIQHENIFFVASELKAFATLKKHAEAYAEAECFTDQCRCSVMTSFDGVKALVDDIVHGRRLPQPMHQKKVVSKPLTIAVMPDDGWSRDITKRNSFSYDWINTILDNGHKVHLVDVYREDIIEQIGGCHGFMWRWSHLNGEFHIAHRILPVIEREMGIPVFPDQHTCWHYDDKAAQEYLLKIHNIPRPRTWIWYDRDRALRWLREEAAFPLVLKLSTGAGSMNVVKVCNYQEGADWVHVLFGQGVFETQMATHSFVRFIYGRCKDFVWMLKTGFSPPSKDYFYTFHRGYALFQRFLPGNEFDVRANVIGNRCFVFKRYTRPNDFRASGSGLLDYEQSGIDNRFIHLAFDTAQKLQTQSIAIDGMYDGDNVVLGEISYTYMAYPLYACGGYWVLDGEPWTGSLRFVPEPTWPGRAMAEDFLCLLEERYAER